MTQPFGVAGRGINPKKPTIQNQVVVNRPTKFRPPFKTLLFQFMFQLFQYAIW